MSLKDKRDLIIESLLKELELPDAAYENARSRYEDLGEWLGRQESEVNVFDPHVFPQGSFRLGTAIKPLNGNDKYDLDLACKLRDGVSRGSHSQKALKDMIGRELEKYRVARGIKEEPISKHRCWRLEYQDSLSFHIDTVPCIPADESKRLALFKSIRNSGLTEELAHAASETTVVITDDRSPTYRMISQDWNISNPEGYAKWFEDQMSKGRVFNMLEKAKIDGLPLFKRRTPLQHVTQLLKRHRDKMFASAKESQPISIILTTLAARAYQGEQDIASALLNVLSKMGNFVQQMEPRVPNPVDPNEDFADRWSMHECSHLRLEENFWNWLTQAKADFESIIGSEKPDFIRLQASRKFDLALNESDLAKSLGVNLATAEPFKPTSHHIVTSNKPWHSKE